MKDMILFQERNGCGLWRPRYKEDEPLFKHCTGGSIAVYEHYLKNDLCLIFSVHGVTLVFEGEKPVT